MTSLRLTVVVALTMATVAAPAVGAGPDVHYHDLIVGERAAGMGGAFTALADEATGAYYNPAGIVVDGSLLLQLSMSAYKLRHSVIDVAQWCNQRFTNDERAFFSFPGSFGLTQQLPDAGPVKHAFGLVVVFPYAQKWSQFFAADRIDCGPIPLGATSASVGVDRELRSSLTYAIRPLRPLQLGVAFGLSARSLSATFGADELVGDGAAAPASLLVTSDATIWSLFVRAGALLRLGDHLRVGVAFTTPLAPVSDTGRLSLVRGSEDPEQWQASEALLLEGVRHRWKVPWQLAAGGAFMLPGLLRVTADVTFHGSVGEYDEYEHPQLPDWFRHEFTNERRAVVNVSAGAELQLTPRWAVRAGAFTNFSSSVEKERIDLYGLTVGGTMTSKQRSSISISAQLQLGDGEAVKYVLDFEDGEYTHREEPVSVSDVSLILTLGGMFDIR